MDINPAALQRDLRSALRQVDDQMKEVRQEAGRTGVDPTVLRDLNGGYVLIPLIAAKAQLLSALVHLQRP